MEQRVQSTILQNTALLSRLTRSPFLNTGTLYILPANVEKSRNLANKSPVSEAGFYIGGVLFFSYLQRERLFYSQAYCKQHIDCKPEGEAPEPYPWKGGLVPRTRTRMMSQTWLVIRCELVLR